MATALTCFLKAFTCSKLIYSSMVLDDDSIKEANSHSQWYLFLRSVASSMEKPLLVGHSKRKNNNIKRDWKDRKASPGINIYVVRVNKKKLPPPSINLFHRTKVAPNVSSPLLSWESYSQHQQPAKTKTKTWIWKSTHSSILHSCQLSLKI